MIINKKNVFIQKVASVVEVAPIWKAVSDYDKENTIHYCYVE